MKAPLRAWDRFWFTPAPLADLAVARVILVCVILALNRMSRFLIVGRATADLWDPVGAIELLGLTKPDLATMQLLAWVTTALLVLAGLGLLTRVALVCVFPLLFVQEALVMSFGKASHATIPVLYLLLFLTIAPCDRRLSVDRALRQALGRDVGANESAFARWPIELFYVVLSGFYFSAGLSKLRTSGPAWADGNTLQFHLLQKGVPLGLEVAEHLWLCALGSAAVLLFQLGFPLGLAPRLRPWFLCAGATFHLGTGVLMDVWFWPLPALYLVFVPWTRVRSRVRRARKAVRTGTRPGAA